MELNETPEKGRFILTIPIDSVWHWWKDRKIKRDINNIKKWGSDYGDYKCDSSDNGATGTDYVGQRTDESGPGINGARDGRGEKENRS